MTRTEALAGRTICLQGKGHSRFDRCHVPATCSTSRLHADSALFAVNSNVMGCQRFYVYNAPLRASRSSAPGLEFSCSRQSRRPETARMTSDIYYPLEKLADRLWQLPQYRAWTKRSRILKMVEPCALEKVYNPPYALILWAKSRKVRKSRKFRDDGDKFSPTIFSTFPIFPDFSLKPAP